MRTPHGSISFVSLVSPLERPSLVHTIIVWCHTLAIHLHKVSGAVVSYSDMNGRGIEAMPRRLLTMRLSAMPSSSLAAGEIGAEVTCVKQASVIGRVRISKTVD
jgi:hypothetical protein